MCRSRSKPVELLMVACIALLAGCESTATTSPAPVSAQYATLSSKLLECSNMQPVSVSTTVGPMGAELSFANNSVSIPAGALLEPVVLTLTIPASPYAEVDVSANGLASFQFERPIEFTIDYARCGRGDAHPNGVWYVDPVTHELLEFMGGVDDPQHRRVTFTTSHLSAYALAD
jgi:hypothetical protein